jgi:hypothetical protein
LRGLLLVLAILVGIGGLVILFDGQLVFLVLPTPTETSAHTIITLLIQDFGALAVGLAVLLYAASRDPVRYVSVIDAFIVILVLLAGVDVYAQAELHFGAMYPGYLIWARVAARLILAIILITLRPKTAG